MALGDCSDARPPLPGFCPSCGYDLRGTSNGECPECGASEQERARIIAARRRRTLGFVPATMSILIAVGTIVTFINFVMFRRIPASDWPFALVFSLLVSLPLGYALVLAIRGIRTATERTIRVWGVFALCVVLGCLMFAAGPFIDLLLR